MNADAAVAVAVFLFERLVSFFSKIAAAGGGGLKHVESEVGQKSFLWSMASPPGPHATTRSKPPMTVRVWKKSYFFMS